MITSAIDAAGNESSCTTILTLIDDEFPEIFPPDPITLDCEDISETQDPCGDHHRLAGRGLCHRQLR
ncbi:MAG: hypothetical protein IPJ00_09635 [Saprospirales bacterium]|nr:hypothetical protein [Saprospirales bacterium]